MTTRLLTSCVGMLAAVLAHADDSQAVSSGSAFNPRISLILDGNAYHDNRDGNGAKLLDAMPAPTRAVTASPDSGNAQGFNLGGSELVMSAVVDPYFDGQVTLTVDSDGATSLEESWIQTRQLPDGVKLKFGKFLSGIGYQNSQHAHAWDFGDQNLAYQAIIGGESLRDTGLQLTWLPPTPFYALVGVEALQGNRQDHFGALVAPDFAAQTLGAGASGALPATRSGPRLTTAWIKFAPDLGESQALQLGFSVAHARQQQQLVDPDDNSATANAYALDGSQQLYALDGVYKWDSPGEYGQGDLKLSGEYLRLRQSQRVVMADAASPLALNDRVRGDLDGYYLQAAYGIAPRWILAGRYDVSGNTDRVRAAGNTTALKGSHRQSLSLAFLPSEFSRIRLQVSDGAIGDMNGTTTSLRQVMLQYTYSLGPHGAHNF